MRVVGVVVGIGLAAVLLPASASAAASRMPVYEVKSAGVSADQAQKLAFALGLSSSPRRPDGSLLFVDDARFQRVPTKPVDGLPPGTAPDEGGRPTQAQALDFDAIAKLNPIKPEVAQARARQAFRAAGIALPGKPRTSHSHFRAVGADRKKLVDKDIDTGVGFAPRLGGLALVGPGAKAGVEFDTEGHVTLLKQATRTLERGATVPLISGARADKVARARLTQGCAGEGGLRGLRLERRLVYYAPSLAHARVKRIVPHYEYSGTAKGENGQRVNLVKFLLPAVQGVPKVSLKLTKEGSRISADTRVRGGTGPYEYHYGSCSTQLSREQAGSAHTSYAYSPKPGLKPKREGGFVTVVDANGLVGVASGSVKTPRSHRASANAFAFPATGGRADTAAEWIGNPQSIWNGEVNSDDFLDEMGDESTIAFNLHDSTVWKTDFQDESKVSGGDDKTWFDNADLLWYEGHGNPDQFVTGEASNNTAGWKLVGTQNIKWGNNDLEWAGFMGCDLLALTDAAGLDIEQRWVQGYKGIHIQAGYVSPAYDFDSVGNEFGDQIADEEHKIRTAWAVSAMEQYVGVIYGYAGPIGSGGVTNQDDHYWNLGSTGPDITTLEGYWLLYGTVL